MKQVAAQMELPELDKLAFRAFSEHSQNRMCLIHEGTGNLLASNNRVFIATCHHVAEAFFREERYKYVSLRNNDRIGKSDLRLLGYYTDPIDIALIELYAPLATNRCYAMEDLEIIHSFDLHNLKTTNIMICGNPYDLSAEMSYGRVYKPVSYMTVPDESRLPSSDFLFCRYPVGTDIIENQSRDPIKLPAARGFSGAFMLTVQQFQGSPQEIWSPAKMRVVAIQQSWDKKSYIKGTGIKHLVRLMEDCGAI